MLLALAVAHDVLTQESWQRAPLRNIVNRALTPLDISGFTIIGPHVPIDASKSYYGGARACKPTRSTKCGALSNDTSHVRIDWTVFDEPTGSRLRLSRTAAHPSSRHSPKGSTPA